MHSLSEVTCALARAYEAERLRQEYARALSERAAAEKESRQVEDLIATLAGPEPLSPKLWSARRHDPMRGEIVVRGEIIVRVEQTERTD